MIFAGLEDHVVHRHMVEHYAVYGSNRFSDQDQEVKATGMSEADEP